MAFALDTGEQICRLIDEIIVEVCPGAGRRSMYGGTVFELKTGDNNTMVCGHFIYKNHVSIEFSNGYLLTDPEQALEGKGKYRRHIKLSALEDVGAKSVRSMIVQAFA